MKRVIRFLGCVGGVAGVVAGPVVAWAADGDLVVAAPTFDWAPLGTVIAAIITVTVGIFVFRKIKSVIR